MRTYQAIHTSPPIWTRAAKQFLTVFKGSPSLTEDTGQARSGRASHPATNLSAPDRLKGQLARDPALRAQAPERAKVIVVSSGHNAFNLK
jgi:hypothetical protein